MGGLPPLFFQVLKRLLLLLPAPIPAWKNSTAACSSSASSCCSHCFGLQTPLWSVLLGLKGISWLLLQLQLQLPRLIGPWRCMRRTSPEATPRSRRASMKCPAVRTLSRTGRGRACMCLFTVYSLFLFNQLSNTSVVVVVVVAVVNAFVRTVLGVVSKKWIWLVVWLLLGVGSHWSGGLLLDWAEIWKQINLHLFGWVFTL